MFVFGQLSGLIQVGGFFHTEYEFPNGIKQYKLHKREIEL